MKPHPSLTTLFSQFVQKDSHRNSDYFALIREILSKEDSDKEVSADAISLVYDLLLDEILTNNGNPASLVSFGTSGWRGILGKDVFVRSVRCVTTAIVRLYKSLASRPELGQHLGVSTLQEAQKRGCLVGYDNRFGGEVFGRTVADVLQRNGFKVYYCGESSTGVLSAALLELQAAFSVNLTPSHNPLDYGGYKYNAADGGPAASELTSLITAYAREEISRKNELIVEPESLSTDISEIDSFELWQRMVFRNKEVHGIDYHDLVEKISKENDITIVIDAVHGASRLHLKRLLGPAENRLQILRGTADVTFGGISPEPSSVNMQGVTGKLSESSSRLKIGAIIDPDGDRIRFTDGETEISMNQFGAMAYHFLHEIKQKKGMVAKTVATSNFANAIARHLGEDVFEPRVGFKEFKPVVGQALVLFEESDGISIIGHTPEKDAYIGLLLALDMVTTTGLNLGDYKRQIEEEYGAFYPDRDAVTVTMEGEELTAALARLEKYAEGSSVPIGDEEKSINEVIAIDGRKMIFDDGSWLMIRPSGTEPKVRFYVESRNPDGTDKLVGAARSMLEEVGLLKG